MSKKERIFLRFYGVRGSHPVCGPAPGGGNTACLRVTAAGRDFVFDCGSGAVALGRDLARRADRAKARKQRLPVFITHFPFDHVQGLPFFEPLFRKDFALDFFGPDSGGEKFAALMRRTMGAPFFPVELGESASAKTFRSLKDSAAIVFPSASAPIRKKAGCKLKADEVAVEAFGAAHPKNGALVYSLRCGEGKIVFATDVELSLQDEERYVRFLSGADLIVHDAQYSRARYASKSAPRAGWGHSTVAMASRAAKLAGADGLVLFHHDPLDGERELAAKLKEAGKLFPGWVEIAREGMEISF